MLSEIKIRISTVSLSSALDVLRTIEVYLEEVRRLYDATFIHQATGAAILTALDDLATSAVMLEDEIAGVRKFFPRLDELVVVAQFGWVSQDLYRIELSLALLKQQLLLSKQPEAAILKTQIERLLE